MKQQCFSNQNGHYTVLTIVTISGMDFAICINEQNEYSCFKYKEVNDRITYTPVLALQKTLPQYQTVSFQNIVNLLSSFQEQLKMESLLSVQNALYEIVFHHPTYFVKENVEVFSKEQFNQMFENQLGHYEKRTVAQLLELEVPKKDYKKEKKGNRKPLSVPVQQFIYMLVVAISFVGFMNCYSAYADWKMEGSSATETTEELIADANIEEVTDGEVIETPTNTNTNSNTNKTSNTNSSSNKTTSSKKNDYWTYMETPLMSVDFTKLKSKNPDTVAWLYVNNTNVNYPVVQTTNNDYYLTHAFDKSKNSAGWVFADYRSDLENFKRNTVIYGHRRKDQVMFGSLGKVTNKSWYTKTENQIIKLSTPTQNTLWQIVSIYTIKEESYYLTHNFASDADYEKFLKKIVSRSIYDFDVEVDKDDKILTLSTCLNLTGDRIVIHAKLVKTQAR